MTASFQPVQWGDGGGTDQVTEGEDGPGAWRLEAVLSLGRAESEMPVGVSGGVVQKILCYLGLKAQRETTSAENKDVGIYHQPLGVDGKAQGGCAD